MLSRCGPAGTYSGMNAVTAGIQDFYSGSLVPASVPATDPTVIEWFGVEGTLKPI